MVYENLIEIGAYGIFKVDMYFWIWCFVILSMSYGGYSISENNFVSDSAFMIPSITTTVIIILVAINLFILAKSAKTKKWDSKIFVKLSLISGLLLIGTMITYMIVIDIVVYDGVDIFGVGFSSAGVHFWKEFDIGFGVIAPFISGILAITGAGIFKYYLNQEFKEDLRVVKGEAIQTKPAIDSHLKFCHSCGAKIKKISAYCEFCGIAQ